MKTEKGKFVHAFLAHVKETHSDKYARGGVETIDLIASKVDLDSFAIGNALKYLSRYPSTKNKKDLLKATHYIQMVYENVKHDTVVESFKLDPEEAERLNFETHKLIESSTYPKGLGEGEGEYNG